MLCARFKSSPTPRSDSLSQGGTRLFEVIVASSCVRSGCASSRNERIHHEICWLSTHQWITSLRIRARSGCTRGVALRDRDRDPPHRCSCRHAIRASSLPWRGHGPRYGEGYRSDLAITPSSRSAQRGVVRITRSGVGAKRAVQGALPDGFLGVAALWQRKPFRSHRQQRRGLPLLPCGRRLVATVGVSTVSGRCAEFFYCGRTA